MVSHTGIVKLVIYRVQIYSIENYVDRLGSGPHLWVGEGQKYWLLSLFNGNTYAWLIALI